MVKIHCTTLCSRIQRANIRESHRSASALHTNLLTLVCKYIVNFYKCKLVFVCLFYYLTLSTQPIMKFRIHVVTCTEKDIRYPYSRKKYCPEHYKDIIKLYVKCVQQSCWLSVIALEGQSGENLEKQCQDALTLCTVALYLKSVNALSSVTS